MSYFISLTIGTRFAHFICFNVSLNFINEVFELNELIATYIN